jgi:peptidoglycan hydrolase CwlO-like protein
VRSIEPRERSSPCPGDGRISDKCPDFGRNPDSCAGEIGRLHVASLLLWSSTGYHTYNLEMIMETSDLTTTILRGIRDDIANLGNRLDGKIDKLDGKIDALGTRLDGKIDKLDTKVDALGARLDDKIDKLEVRLDGKIDALGTRLDGQSGKLDELALRLDKHDRRFDRLDNRMDKLDSKLDKLESRIDKHDDRFDKLDDRFDQLGGKFDRLETELRIEVRVVREDLQQRIGRGELDMAIRAVHERMDRIYGQLVESDLRATAAHEELQATVHQIMSSLGTYGSLETRVDRCERDIVDLKERVF